MRLLDGFFSPKYGLCCGAFLAGAFFSFFCHALLCSCLAGASSFLRHFLKQGHILSNKMVSGPVCFENNNIRSDFVILDLL